MVGRFLIFVCVIVQIAMLGTGCTKSDSEIVGSNVRDLGWEEFELLPIDTFMYVDNRGLERIRADLNGHLFQLTADSIEAAQNNTAYWMPRQGDVTLNIAAFILPENNMIRLNKQGPPGSEALILIGDLLLPGDSVEYVLGKLSP